MMATSSELNARDNVTVMHFMENEVLNLARRKNFAGILTTNTSPLTQQLGSDVYGYKTYVATVSVKSKLLTNQNYSHAECSSMLSTNTFTTTERGPS